MSTNRPIRQDFSTKLNCERLEDRMNPSKFSISLLSPLTGEVGDTAASHSGGLTLSNTVVDASDATAAVVNAFSGSISVVGAGSYSFGPSNVGVGKPYQIESSGEQFAIAMEDMAGQTGSDDDYNDRVWLMMVRQIGSETVVHTSTTTWSAGPNGTASVALTVTENKPGYEGRYFWNYHVTNVDFYPPEGLSQFALQVPETGGMSDISNNLGWQSAIEPSLSGPYTLRWQATTISQRLTMSESGDFSFTTPVCGIEDSSGAFRAESLTPPPPPVPGPPGTPGAQAEPVAPSGPVKAPALIIRSVTLWGEPGAPDPFGAVGGGPANISGVILGSNPNAGGGKRVFPEKPTVTSNTDFNRVSVRVELSQPVVQAKNIDMYQFDVDDPSTMDFVIDNEFNPTDNRFADDGLIATGFAITVDAGKSVGSTLRFVSYQPGDNYRFVANIDPNVTLGGEAEGPNVVKVYRTHLSSEIHEFPVTLYANDDQASACFDSGEGSPVGTGEGKTVASTLLTVWRQLHVERDWMGPPPDNEPFAGAGMLMPNSVNEGDKEGDDDAAPNWPDGSVPRPLIGFMQTYYRDAYIEVVDDLDGVNPNKTTPFVHNMSTAPGGFNPALGVFDNYSRNPLYWSFQLIGGYEPETNRDHDGADNPTARDGATSTAKMISFVYMETARDLWESRPAAVKTAVPFGEYLQRVAFHESVHIFGFDHDVDDFANEGPLSVANNNTGTAASNKFTPAQLNVIRSKIRPGVIE